ncbi:MAG: GTPase ObgE [Acidimicrobiales bacterium]
MEISIDLPNDFAAAYATSDRWWKVRYVAGSSPTDRPVGASPSWVTPSASNSSGRPRGGRSLAGVSSFVDECNINVKAGDGGAGCVSFRREAHVAKGGPDGGDGDGGSVWLVADHNVASLLALRDHPHRKASSGTHGSGSNRHGARAADLEVAVPVGTVVLDHETREPLADLIHHGDRWCAAAAGKGGRGNARFLSNSRRAPSFAEQGEHGEERWLRLELKLEADVAIIGFPNVGKSTLISRLSAAKPKIADYPFTTLEPNLGVVRTDDGVEIVLADIPGLIEGASEGKGLGHTFLRHVERAKVLLVLLDLAPYDQVGPAAQLEVLLHELGNYQADLLDRPRLVVGSRAAMAPEHTFTGPVISSVTGQGLAALVGELIGLVALARAEVPETTTITIHHPESNEVQIGRHDDGSWEVYGRAAPPSP